ncbi:calcium-binding protein [Rhizobium sp. TH2]|uniref:calcium-binding protein n=1 Tax=Rhizobium sp. TH2 TaxID=2775403 RepID=UPI002157EB62|nr:calcium-binding protein [Rhizobium sp. TH2]UVC07078.1 calcium-binding protein [Rhizobium sp. TH2]
MKRYNGTYAEGFEFDKPNRDIVFGSQSVVVDDDTAITIEPDARGSELVLGGDISADLVGVQGSANDTSIRILEGANVTSRIALLMTGRNQSLKSAGDITADEIGILVSAPGSHIVNQGDVTSARVSVVLQNSENGRFVNGRSGELVGDEFGVIIGGATISSENWVKNLGTIVSPTYALLGSSTIEHVTNRGLIDGATFLYGGNDTFDSRGGTVTGQVHGGEGNDTFVIDDPLIPIVEAQNNGEDTVISSVSYELPDNFETLKLTGRKDLIGRGNNGDNTVSGNKGDNVLFGGDGNNILAGGAGDDRLIGGADIDTFVFKTGYGHDTIEYFQDGLDYLDLVGWKGLRDIDVLMSHAREANGNLVISFKGDELTIENFTKVQLDPGDFVS